MELRRGWWLMCLVMAIYYVIIIYLIPGYVGFERSSTILKPAISLLMAGVYSILMFHFTSIKGRWRHGTAHSCRPCSCPLFRAGWKR